MRRFFGDAFLIASDGHESIRTNRVCYIYPIAMSISSIRNKDSLREPRSSENTLYHRHVWEEAKFTQKSGVFAPIVQSCTMPRNGLLFINTLSKIKRQGEMPLAYERNILALIALAGCAFASASFDTENRDINTDLKLVSREGLDVGIELLDASGNNAFVGREHADVDVEARYDLDSVGRSDPDIVAREPQPPIPPQCPPRRQAVVFLRRGRFPFRTLSFIGFFFQTRRFNTTPLFLVYKRSPNDYFYTTSPAEARRAVRDLGYTSRGIAGFIFVDARCGGVPLYRTFNGRRRQHFYTTSLAQRNIAKQYGYFNQGITGYIFRI